LILVDTSVWIDHLRRRNEELTRLLIRGEVVCHPFVLGELACGQLQKRTEVLGLLRRLPQAETGGHEEVLAFVERHDLMGVGIGWIDAHLLVAAILAHAHLWTYDRSLARAWRRLGNGSRS
jgi:predicted nucleic acid-binding protein